MKNHHIQAFFYQTGALSDANVIYGFKIFLDAMVLFLQKKKKKKKSAM